MQYSLAPKIKATVVVVLCCVVGCWPCKTMFLILFPWVQNCRHWSDPDKHWLSGMPALLLHGCGSSIPQKLQHSNWPPWSSWWGGCLVSPLRCPLMLLTPSHPCPLRSADPTFPKDRGCLVEQIQHPARQPPNSSHILTLFLKFKKMQIDSFSASLTSTLWVVGTEKKWN